MSDFHAFVSQFAVPIRDLEVALGVTIAPDALLRSADGHFLLLPVTYPGRSEQPVPRQPMEQTEPRSVAADVTSATTVARDWGATQRTRLSRNNEKLGKLLRAEFEHLLKADPTIRFVQHETSVTVVLPDGRRAGVRPRTTQGLRHRALRGGGPPLLFFVNSESDFDGVLNFLRALPPRGAASVHESEEDEHE